MPAHIERVTASLEQVVRVAKAELAELEATGGSKRKIRRYKRRIAKAESRLDRLQERVR